MDGREGMSLQGAASYYLNRGGIGGSGSLSNVHGGSQTPPGFKALTNPNFTLHPHVGASAAFHVENPSPNFPHGMSTPIVSQSGETVKKKRGRPRKYGPEGPKMSLALSQVSASKLDSSGEKPRRGRPPGTGWKQKLAPLGEWMNNSAGLAFTPHVLQIGVGEDIAAKILAFAQQRTRALCILSGSGSVSTVTLRQPTNSGSNVIYEGRFEILCLSGSYLLTESGGPRNRTGGISISVSTPDGHMIGGAVGGRLIAANNVQVVACSFVYGSTKAKNKAESETADEKYMPQQSSAEKSTPAKIGPSQSPTPNSGASIWPLDVKNSEPKFDLMHG